MTGSWLSGPRAALNEDAGDPDKQKWPGERLGLPQDGPGAVASVARRGGALIVDLIVASLLTGIVTHPNFGDPASMTAHNWWSVLTWSVITVGMVATFGFTPGMGLLGIRVIRMDGAAMVGLVRAIPRTVLSALIVPAVLINWDGRGWHDRAAGTIVVHLR
ncbi:RDD family protein [Herbihabitans rhizosphaerae]|uniref:RDD family protein n=1 Tax=Herbihabitans rhizosphaerae TaxID=1872711 RepID=A0A4Q7KDX7_9PSEU|nr:RDD family protein [Herbihabitans rhizosphaerae]